jgi:hypothetical protein
MAATIQDALDAVQAAKSRVDTDVAALNATIADLQAQLGTSAVDLQPIVDAANAIDPAPAPVAAADVAPADQPAA